MSVLYSKKKKKKKWLDIESKHTKSERQGKFVQCFEKKQAIIIQKQTANKRARNRAHLSYGYWDCVTTAVSNDDRV